MTVPDASAAAPPAAKILYRAEEAATLLSISRTAIFGLIRSGDLQAVKIGGRRRIPRSSIEDYVARQLGETANAQAQAADLAQRCETEDRL